MIIFSALASFALSSATSALASALALITVASLTSARDFYASNSSRDVTSSCSVTRWALRASVSAVR
eukprot:6554228-Prymnesium_polylepis.1